MKAGTVDDIEKIAQALREGEWDSAYGKTRFIGAKFYGSPAFIQSNIYLSKYEGGKIITFDRVQSTLP